MILNRTLNEIFEACNARRMTPQDTPTTLCVIHAVEFQPFESRQGRDTVIGLTFPFNRPIAEILKQCFARYRQQLYDPEHFIHSAGGWLARERCWFVEHAIWPTVQRELEAAGYEIHSQCGAMR